MGIEEIRAVKAGKAKEEKKPKWRAQYSKKRQKENRHYNKEARIFKMENPRCGIMSRVCTGATQGVHHKKGRGKYLRVKEFWMPACNPCNEYAEAHPEEAREKGWKESKF